MSVHYGWSLDGLEAALDDLADDVDFPPTPDIASVVGARLREPAAAPPTQPEHRPWSPGWRPRGRRTLGRSLALAALLALLAAGVALGVRLGLDLLSIEFGTIPPTPTVVPRPSSGAMPTGTFAPGQGLGLGRAASLADARSASDFPVLLPARLPAPAVVFLGGPALRGQVAMLFPSSATLPPSDLLDGAGMLLTQNRGAADEGLANKLVRTGAASVERVDVAGARGLWISGDPHVFWYFAPDGTAIEDSRRLVGDTLAWERDGVLYRIEGAMSREEALAIAASLR